MMGEEEWAQLDPEKRRLVLEQIRALLDKGMGDKAIVRTRLVQDLSLTGGESWETMQTVTLSMETTLRVALRVFEVHQVLVSEMIAKVGSIEDAALERPGAKKDG